VVDFEIGEAVAEGEAVYDDGQFVSGYLDEEEHRVEGDDEGRVEDGDDRDTVEDGGDTDTYIDNRTKYGDDEDGEEDV
jgi:hypothetical protein